MIRMFRRYIAFDGGLSTWDVSNVTDMDSILDECEVFKGNYHNGKFLE